MLRNLRAKVKNQKGFTLIELLVVISIIGVLAAIGVPKFMDTTATARTAKIQAELGAIDSALQIYGANHAGTLTTKIDDLDPYMSGNKVPKIAVGKYKIGAAAAVEVKEEGSYTLVDGQASCKIGEAPYTATTLAAAVAKP